MEFLVDIEHLPRIDWPLAGNGVQLGVERRQPVGERTAHGGGQPRHQHAGQRLEVADDGVELLRVFLGQRRDEQARLARALVLDDVALALQNCSAPRTGVRLRPSRSARSASTIDDPGERWPSTISCRSSW